VDITRRWHSALWISAARKWLSSHVSGSFLTLSSPSLSAIPVQKNGRKIEQKEAKRVRNCGVIWRFGLWKSADMMGVNEAMPIFRRQARTDCGTPLLSLPSSVQTEFLCFLL
jgi:hypothetical protein